MRAVVLRARLESVLGERIPSPFTGLEKRVSESLPTGIAPLDAWTGGLPRGGISEICGPASSGRTSLMISILAETTERDEVCALMDGGDAFDPKSGMASGLDLQRLLWVRCHKLDQVLKSTDLLLQGGGFGCVIMDLSDLAWRNIQSIPLATWFRFQRTIEKTPTVLVVITPESVVQSAAALVVRLGMREADWSTVLNGMNLNFEILRSRRGAQARQGEASRNRHCNSNFEFRISK